MSSKGQGGVAQNKVLKVANLVPNASTKVIEFQIEKKSNINLAILFWFSIKYSPNKKK
jgi:hypothetical protein